MKKEYIRIFIISFIAFRKNPPARQNQRNLTAAREDSVILMLNGNY